jgi:hypothetical protein
MARGLRVREGYTLVRVPPPLVPSPKVRIASSPPTLNDRNAPTGALAHYQDISA